MKKNQRLIHGALLVCASVISTAALAGTVTIPNAFISGTKAVAEEVNANFNAVKIEVDDNASEINDISGDLSLLASEIDTLQAPSGSVSVAAHAFRNEDAGNNCLWTTYTSFSFGFYAAGGDINCNAVAGIQIPDSVVLKSLSCTVFDNSFVESINSIALKRVNLTSGDGDVIFQTGFSDKPGKQKIIDDTAASVSLATVDNSDNAYSIHVDFTEGTNVSGGNLALYGCSVSY